jgi:uncharacterized protein (DUF1684 family)
MNALGVRMAGCALLVLLTGGCATGGPVDAHADWRTGCLEWRAEREEHLRSPDGYLALSNLVWLADGDSCFGADPSCAVVFADDDIPVAVGVLRLANGVVSLDLSGFAPLESVKWLDVDPPPVRISETGIVGHSADAYLLASDMTGSPNRVTLGRRTFWVIDRAGQIGIRVADPQSPVLESFGGTDWFEPDESWRVRARFEPYSEAVAMDVPNVLGTAYDDESPGVLRFERAGRAYELHPTGSGPESMSLIFGDATNGAVTYGGGRFLGVSAPDADGMVWLDFNRAYNPPCAFSPFTTCPLPPAGNRLELAVTAGERMPPGHD